MILLFNPFLSPKNLHIEECALVSTVQIYYRSFISYTRYSSFLQLLKCVGITAYRSKWHVGSVF